MNSALRFVLIFLSAVVFDFKAAAQQDLFYKQQFDRVDSLASKNKNEDALALITSINTRAKKDNNTQAVIKSVMLRMLFVSYLKSNDLAKHVSELKVDLQTAKQPEKSILQSILAEAYWNFYQQNRYKFANRTTIAGDVGEDISLWSLRKIQTESLENYRASLAERNLLFTVQLKDLPQIIKGDNSAAYLRPTLYDLLAHRALMVFVNTELNVSFELMGFDNAAFVNEQMTSLINYHKDKGNRAAWADAEFLKIKYEKILAWGVWGMSPDYIQKLENLVLEVRDTEIYSDVLYELASIYQEGRGNVEGDERLIKAVDYLTKSMLAYPESDGAKKAVNLLKIINTKSLNIEVAAYNIPGTNVRLNYSARNVDSIYYRVYKLPLLKLSGDELSDSEHYNQFIAKNKPVLTGEIGLKFNKDYLTHTLGTYLNELALGRYLVLIRNHSFDVENDDMAYSSARFHVTNLDVSTRSTETVGDEYKVLNATNGESIEGVLIERVRTNDKNLPYVTEASFRTDENGYARSEDSQRAGLLRVTHQKDTVLKQYYRAYYNSYKDQTRIKLFLDRPIYRPGQKVFFKGLVFDVNGSKNDILKHEEVIVSFKDSNGQQVSSQTLTSNEYGTFHGSFDIPLGKKNGAFFIETKFGRVDVRVEEYKRPSFEVLMDKISGRLRLNDFVTVTGKVIAYSGYKISGATLKYKVSNGNLIDTLGTTLTQSDGSFKIRFFAKAKAEVLNMHYDVRVEATDLSGETRVEVKSVTVSKNDLMFSVLTSRPYYNIFKGAKDSISFTASNVNYAPVKVQVTASWYQLKAPLKLSVLNKLSVPDSNMQRREEFMAMFPNHSYGKEAEQNTWPAMPLSLKQEGSGTGSGHLVLDQSKLAPGYYDVYFEAVSEHNDTLKVKKTFRVFGSQPDTILRLDEWVVAERNIVKSGGNAIFRLAGMPGSVIHYEVIHKDSVITRGAVKVGPVQSILSIPVKPEYKNSLTLQFAMVTNGVTYQQFITTLIDDPARQLEVKYLSFRDKLEPGQKETWKLRITSKNGDAKMAELLATMYDASLDQFGWMDWNFYGMTERFGEFQWTSGLNYKSQVNNLYFLVKQTPVTESPVLKAYPSLNYKGYQFFGTVNAGYYQYLMEAEDEKKKEKDLARELKLEMLQKGSLFYGVARSSDGYPLAGVPVFVNGDRATTTDALGIYSVKAKDGDQLSFRFKGFGYTTANLWRDKRNDVVLKGNVSQGLEEVVIRGYVKRTREETTGSSYIVSGSDAPVANVVQQLQGKVAGTGTPGRVEAGSEPLVRTNFSETAFFYPQLKTNESGEINIEFTVPESLTRFKFMGFAHTAELNTFQFSSDVLTQKQLSIIANAPRFFREGDTVQFSARLNNLSGKKRKGNAKMELRDAITGNLISILNNKTLATQKFTLANDGNRYIKWTLIIPKGISAITYRITAESGRYSDGEEMTIPVLTNSTLVTETIQLNVRGNTTKSFSLDKLVQSGGSSTMRHQGLTLEFTSNPVWYAVQSLPYLMEYPYECAEQTMSRFYANSFATGIINSSPQIKKVFESWSQSGSDALASRLEKNEELKSVLLEETPWVRNAISETERKRRLGALLNLERMSGELKRNFEKLESMQYADGSFPWFSGMQSSRYITQHVVLNLAQLKYLNLIDEQAIAGVSTMLNKAIIWLDNMLIADYNRKDSTKYYALLPLHYLYARSYSKQINENPAFKKVLNTSLINLEIDWRKLSVYQQAMAALVLERYGKHEVALQVVASLKERATQDEETGMFWEANKSGWWWYQGQIETQALLIEVFDEVAGDAKSVEEMKVWLMKHKQTNDWKTTKATTAACYALLMRGYNLLGESAAPNIKLGGKTFQEMGIAEPVREAGTGYQKLTIEGTAVKPEMGKVEVHNNNKTMAWGSLYWQYFEQLDKITPAATGVTIKKQLFIQEQTATGPVLKVISSSNVLKTGDLIKVRIEIRCERDMEYLHLKDMRSSGFEPVNVISQYKYQDGLGYYESTKDASTNFFISYMAKGSYVFEYPLRVANSGKFSNGITSLQSMYAPEFTTHSEGIKVTVK